MICLGWGGMWRRWFWSLEKIKCAAIGLIFRLGVTTGRLFLMGHDKKTVVRLQDHHAKQYKYIQTVEKWNTFCYNVLWIILCIFA